MVTIGWHQSFIMQWKHRLILQPTSFITGWHHTFPVITSFQSQSFQKRIFGRRIHHLSCFLQSDINKEPWHKILACGQQMLLCHCSHPCMHYFSSMLRFGGCSVKSFQCFSTHILGEEFDEEFSVKGVEDDFNVGKGKKISRVQNRYCIVDEHWAKAIVKKLKKVINFQDRNVLIVECNPGKLYAKSYIINSSP